jgi:hypothetical protein
LLYVPKDADEKNSTLVMVVPGGVVAVASILTVEPAKYEELFSGILTERVCPSVRLERPVISEMATNRNL